MDDVTFWLKTMGQALDAPVTVPVGNRFQARQKAVVMRSIRKRFSTIPEHHDLGTQITGDGDLIVFKKKRAS